MRRIAPAMAVAALCLMAGAADALAQAYYLGIRGGYDYPHESQIQANGVSGLDATFDPDGAAAAAFGFEWIDGWRYEGELSWRRDAFDSVDNVPVNNGRAEIYAAMVNVYYGFRRDAIVNPYLGGGIGAARLSVGDLAVGAATVDDFGVAMAWQGIVGVDFALSPSWKLSLDYRYFSMEEVKLADSLQRSFKTDFMASTAMLGLRVGF
jgi:opacity protein-like surface antigen